LRKVGEPGDEVSNLLMEPTNIKLSDPLGDVHDTLEHLQLPSYAGIRRKFSLGRGDTGSVVDLTTRSLNEMRPTVHAVVVVAYDKQRQWVSYKDPNYGDITIVVNLRQFRQMAGNSAQQMTLRYYAEARSGLKDLQD
jgi:hypothetical protein